MPTGPPDKTATLSTADYKTAAEFNDAVTKLYDQGYEFAFSVPASLKGIDGMWVVFQGYSQKP